MFGFDLNCGFYFSLFLLTWFESFPKLNHENILIIAKTQQKSYFVAF